uniref:EB domain-containing protein n=1 Tax=Loa loa TaxID=7209 RepID=A0A1I7VAV5_LOALO
MSWQTCLNGLCVQNFESPVTTSDFEGSALSPCKSTPIKSDAREKVMTYEVMDKTTFQMQETTISNTSYETTSEALMETTSEALRDTKTQTLDVTISHIPNEEMSHTVNETEPQAFTKTVFLTTTMADSVASNPETTSWTSEREEMTYQAMDETTFQTLEATKSDTPYETTFETLMEATSEALNVAELQTFTEIEFLTTTVADSVAPNSETASWNSESEEMTYQAMDETTFQTLETTTSDTPHETTFETLMEATSEALNVAELQTFAEIEFLTTTVADSISSNSETTSWISATCVNDSQCNPQQLCTVDGHCVPHPSLGFDEKFGSECKTNKQCGMNEICVVRGYCVPDPHSEQYGTVHYYNGMDLKVKKLSGENNKFIPCTHCSEYC